MQYFTTSERRRLRRKKRDLHVLRREIVCFPEGRIELCHGKRLEIRILQSAVLSNTPAAPDCDEFEVMGGAEMRAERSEHGAFAGIDFSVVHDFVEHFIAATNPELFGAERYLKDILEVVPFSDREQIVAARFCAKRQCDSLLPATGEEIGHARIKLSRA